MVRVAILGAGIGGVVTLNELSEVYQCTCYESKGSAGGIWGTAYQNEIKLQIEPRIYRFPNTPHWPEGKDGRLIHQYVNQYLAKSGLVRQVKYGCHIQQITRNGPSFQLHVWDQTTQSVRIDGPYDYVICTGTVSHGKIPPVLRHGYSKPMIIHTSKLTNQLVTELRHQHLVVYGGSKSATDAILRLKAHNTITWVARRFYSFARETSGTTVSLRRAMTCVPRLRGFLPCLTEYRVHPEAPPYPGSFNFFPQPSINN